MHLLYKTIHSLKRFGARRGHLQVISYVTLRISVPQVAVNTCPKVLAKMRFCQVFLQPAEAPRIEQLNMRLSEHGRIA